jgi:hypothetical protein
MTVTIPLEWQPATAGVEVCVQFPGSKGDTP